MAIYNYTTPTKVQNLLQLQSAFSSSTVVTTETVENHIARKEAFIDNITNSSWAIRQVPDYEYYDSDEFLPDRNIGIKIFLGHNRIKTLSAALGDKLEIWDGSSYVDWLGTKTEGRNDDYWFDYKQGILFIVGTGYQGIKKVRIIYRYGGTETEINGSHTDSVTTITVDSTTGFQQRGVIRVNFSEEISYVSKTSTTFTTATRGVNNTTATSYTGDEIVQQIPGDIEEACTKLVAIELLTSEDMSALLPENSPPNFAFSEKIRKWQEDVNRILDAHKEIVVV